MGSAVDNQEEIMIELIGGPKDGAVLRLKPPYAELLEFQSAMRNDVYHIYRFDTKPNNVNFPLKFIFEGYARK